MNLTVWLLIGGLIGWAASVLMATDGRQGILLNVVVGIVGTAIGGWLLSNVFGLSTINQDNLSVSVLVVSFYVAVVILLAIATFLRRT
jgi:uncharacterized membrane protein YeaQ/YmgE (transglycosylase-associated protein family)